MEKKDKWMEKKKKQGLSIYHFSILNFHFGVILFYSVSLLIPYNTHTIQLDQVLNTCYMKGHTSTLNHNE